MVQRRIDRRPIIGRIPHPETFFQTIPGFRRVLAVRGLGASLAAVPAQHEGRAARRRNCHLFLPETDADQAPGHSRPLAQSLRSLLATALGQPGSANVYRPLNLNLAESWT
jgi:hypothetical protein